MRGMRQQAPSLPVSPDCVGGSRRRDAEKREFSAQASSASLRPLNNVFMPAVAVELAPGGKWCRRLDLRQLSTTRRVSDCKTRLLLSATAWGYNSDSLHRLRKNSRHLILGWGSASALR